MNSGKIKKIIFAIMFIIAIVLVAKSHNEVEAKTPYIAFNMLLQTQIKVNNQNADYLEFLKNSFGASKKQIEQVYSFLSHQENEKDVRWKVNEEIKKSLKEYGNIRRKKKDFFVINILAPYLTLMVNQFYIDKDDSQEIQKIFAEVFSIEKMQRNFLDDLEKSTLAFNSGGYFNINYRLDLNSLLQTEGFYLDYNVRRNYSFIYKISKIICNDIQWKNNGKFNIFLLKRIYPHILPPATGFSSVFADNVVVIEDFYPLLARKYSKKKNVDLSSKDFMKSSLKQIETALIIQTAIHEAKHKADEFEAPNQRLNIDNEISAYLTAAIFGPCPFNGLSSMIEILKGFQRNVNSRALNNVLHQLNNLEAKTLNQNYKPEQLRIELRKIYANYRTITGNEPFIDLAYFESHIVPAIYKAFE